MAFLTFIYRYGLWIAPPLFMVSTALLILSITGVVRTVRQARLFAVALREQQEVEFTHAGQVVLCLEGPPFSMRYGNLKYDLLDRDGQRVSGRSSLFHAKSSSFTKATIELKIYDVLHPGRFTLRIEGLGETPPAQADYQVVFMRPHLGRSMTYVLGIVLTAVLAIGALVLFLLRLYESNRP